MQEAEAGARRAVQRAQMLAGCLQQFVSAADVAAQERAGVVDRAIDVCLGGEVDDGAGRMFAEQLAHALAVGDVHAYEGVARMASQSLEVLEVARVRQAIRDQHAVAGLGQREADEVGADEARAPGDDQRAHARAKNIS